MKSPEGLGPKDNGPYLSSRLWESPYINERTAGQPIFMDTSRLKIGKNSFPN